LAEVGANSNLGAVFATLAARPFWYGAQLPVYFLASAVTCGAAAIIMFTHIAYKLRGEEVDAETKAGIKSAGKIMTMMLFLLAVATVWRTIVFFTGETELSSAAVANLLTGPASINFWLFETLIGMVIPIGLLLFSRMENLAAMSAAAFMVLVGAFFQRYDLVTVGQQTPVYYGLDTSLPSFMGYAPSAGELLVVMGGIALTFLGFLAGERLFGKVFRHSGHH
jgi:molybdopterin-containing oxidoreductase family membrane subunit